MARRNKSKQDIVDAAKKMPPLYHKIPGEEFSLRKARTLSGAIRYNPNTQKWQGVDFVQEDYE